MSWEADLLEDLYGTKAESDLTKTRNFYKLVATAHIN